MLATVWSVVKETAMRVSSCGAMVGADVISWFSVGATVGNKPGRVSVGANVVGDTVVGAYDTGD